jgi:4-hydroxyphenylacetate 3-monooxygenase
MFFYGLYLNSHAIDFENPYLDKYVRGSNGYAVVDRVQGYEACGTRFGSEYGSHPRFGKTQMS